MTEYKYIRRLVTSNNETSKEIGQIITSGWRRLGEYSRILEDKMIAIYLKRIITKTIILPAMTYRAETWALTKNQEKKLAVAKQNMEYYKERRDSK